MSVNFRVAAIVTGLAVAIAGALATPALFPQAFADEPQHQLIRRASDLFPPPFDPRKLRKYDIVLADSVSTEPVKTRTVSKIAYGHKSTVVIVTTNSGTYSSDALTSPYVRYPGIEVSPKYANNDFALSTYASPRGTATVTTFSSGSFTFYNYSFTPSKRP